MAAAAADRLILGTRKGLLIFERTKGAWKLAREAFVGIAVPYAFRDARNGVLWASLDHGHWGQKLQRSSDWGAAWTEVPAPRYAENAVIKDGVPATLRYIWVTAPGGADEPRRLYLGTEPGGLFVSDDGGQTFQIIEALWNHPSRKEHWFGGGRDHPGIHSVFVDPRDSRRVLVGISCAGVFETTDAGQTWQPRNAGLKATFLPNPEAEVGHDPHLLVACAAQPDFLWQQNHCGIFRSADGAKSWQDVSQPGGPAFFGFAVAADAARPETAWVVPGVSDEMRVAHDRRLCVCRTDDGGRTWKALREGLPQEHCYDIVLRHGLDVAGDRLAFGTTTGNLFVSDDRGESWRCLSHHLPPVYSVRFAPGD